MTKELTEFMEVFIKSKIKNLSSEDFILVMNTWKRYVSESHTLCLLSCYALNKEKNILKGNFEDLSALEIFELFLGEVEELRNELEKEKKDPKRILEEVSDCAALLTGMVANTMHQIQKES